LAYPLLMVDTQKVKLSTDFRLATWELALLHAEPSQRDKADVRNIQDRALWQLQALLELACAELDAELASPPEFSYFQEAGPNRLTGINALASFRVANLSACCH
jgi:hypothetical protein